MQRNITKADIRDRLAAFIVAIKLDQIRVDALPARAFHCEYSESMWRLWRREHLEYLDLLFPTVEAIPQVTLERLTLIATQCDPKVVSERLLEFFGAASAHSVPRKDVATARIFFNLLIDDVSPRLEGKPVGYDARVRMMRWLRPTDPLHIARDPECGYGAYLGGYVAS